MLNETTGRALVALWESTATNGTLVPPTANQWAAACARVLQAYVESNHDGRPTRWEDVDVSRIDVDAALRAFRARSANTLAPSTIDTYTQIFVRAVPSFLDYMAAPEAWQPPIRSRRSSLRKAASSSAAPPAPATSGPSVAGTPGSSKLDAERMLEIPIHLRSGATAVLRIPSVLSEVDGDILLDSVRAQIKASIQV